MLAFILAFIGTIAFVVVMFMVAYGMNKIMDIIATKRGWYTKPLRKNHWYDKYTNKAMIWYIENKELMDQGKL